LPPPTHPQHGAGLLGRTLGFLAPGWRARPQQMQSHLPQAGLGLRVAAWLGVGTSSGEFVAGYLHPARVWFAAGLSAPLIFLPVQARSPASTCQQQLQHWVGFLGEELVACVQDSPLACTKLGKSTVDLIISSKCSCTRKALMLWSFLAAECLASRSKAVANDTLPQHQLLSLCGHTPPLRRCISNTSGTARCGMDVACAEKFLHWINAFCVLLLLPGVKPGCARRNCMSCF